MIAWLKQARQRNKEIEEKGGLLFSNEALRKLIIPLTIEQMLTMAVGLVSVMMVSHAGEAAVSGVSLVTMLNAFFIFLFGAIATGGAVVISQYIGKGDQENGCYAASQLVTTSLLLSTGLMLFVLVFRQHLLNLLFGGVEADVMAASLTFFVITAYSYPFLAMHSVGASLFRSMGRANVTMYVAIVMNVINLVGSAVAIFVLEAGIFGIALANLASRVAAALIMAVMSYNEKNQVYIRIRQILSIRLDMVKLILKVAVPSSVESGLFQLSRIFLLSIIATFGTAQIVANGVANSIDFFGAMVVMSMNMAIVTVVGQCVGAGDFEQAKYYVRKLMKYSFIGSAAVNLAVIALLPLILNLFYLSDEARELSFTLVVIHNVFIIFFGGLAFPMAGAIRAAGDVKFAMLVVVVATAVFRVFFSFVFGVWMGLGIIGVWIAMVLDWGIRGLLFGWRYRSGKWMEYKLV